eukprot:9491583-Pyramimonas_sp.AAC.1
MTGKNGLQGSGRDFWRCCIFSSHRRILGVSHHEQLRTGGSSSRSRPLVGSLTRPGGLQTNGPG